MPAGWLLKEATETAFPRVPRADRKCLAAPPLPAPAILRRAPLSRARARERAGERVRRVSERGWRGAGAERVWRLGLRGGRGQR